MTENTIKCSTCIGKYEYKTAIPCRYCKWNKEHYWGRNESKMVNDNYKYVVQSENGNIPY